MKLLYMVVAAAFIAAAPAMAKTPQAYMSEAGEREAVGDIAGAATLLEAGLAEHGDDPGIMGQLGMYLGMQAGSTNDQQEAMTLVSRSMTLLDNAAEMAPGNPMVRFYRGVIFVQVPDFLNRYKVGIEDLEFVVAQAEQGNVPPEMIVAALFNLGEGYRKAGRIDDARNAWVRVTQMAQGSPIAGQAEQAISGIESIMPGSAQNSRQLLEEIPGVTELQRRMEADPENIDLIVEYMGILGTESEQYDERTHIATGFRTMMAMEVVACADKVMALSDDPALRLECAAIYVEMPFFVSRIDRGIAELERIVASDLPGEITAEAAYWLGFARQKQAVTRWISVIKEYPGTPAADMALSAMYPSRGKAEMDTVNGAHVMVEFDLGYRDELAPQTAVWLETMDGEFLKTLYVSGFSGYAREQQVNLPQWSDISNHVDTDGVTAASIDAGTHAYCWDCCNQEGHTVPPGEYRVHVESSWWPSMQYEQATAVIRVGSGGNERIADSGTFIPYMRAEYVPE